MKDVVGEPRAAAAGGRRVSISDDRRELTIVSPQGHRAVYRSARAGGFTEADIAAARTVAFSTRIRGQVNRRREIRVGTWVVGAHVNTGPPTWWRPRIEVGGRQLMAGWLRLLVAVSWDRAQPSPRGRRAASHSGGSIVVEGQANTGRPDISGREKES